MNTLQMARAAGFVILLDGRIGCETYHSVTGSLSALERFQALCGAAGSEAREAGDASAMSDRADSRESLAPAHEGCEP